MDCTQKVRVSEDQPRSPEPGVLAQLEERSTSNWKVDGSSPLIATSKAKVLITCNSKMSLSICKMVACGFRKMTQEKVQVSVCCFLQKQCSSWLLLNRECDRCFQRHRMP